MSYIVFPEQCLKITACKLCSVVVVEVVPAEGAFVEEGPVGCHLQRSKVIH